MFGLNRLNSEQNSFGQLRRMVGFAQPVEGRVLAGHKDKASANVSPDHVKLGLVGRHV
jgi:hypothetical protein